MTQECSYNKPMSSSPKRIVCLTEESVETLFLLGKSELIVGVSHYVERPTEAKNLPKVSHFLSGQQEKIVALKPDLILGFSDIQKDLARDLIGRGQNVFVTNQRTFSEIFDYILMLSRIVDAADAGEKLVDSYRRKLDQFTKKNAQRTKRPKVYFEEWDEPKISAIQWVNQLIKACGGDPLFGEHEGVTASERFVSDEEIIKRNPDIIFGCWCGKTVKLDQFYQRPGWEKISAVKNKQVFELAPEVFLQPGPALFEDGLDLMSAALDLV
jgi:iron complex transport system substrate-binding protein